MFGARPGSWAAISMGCGRGRTRAKYRAVAHQTRAFVRSATSEEEIRMNDSLAVAERPQAASSETFDAIIIGAGISGMFMLYRLRELGMTARVFEMGNDVGGTWYWNRYPGARFDSESWTYGYSFSKELMQEWDWKEHFSPQPDTLAYLNHVAEKFDLRRDMQFSSTVTSAHWDDATNQWTVTLENGEQARSRLLFTAIG